MNIKSMLKETWDTAVFVVVALIIIRFFVFEPRYIPSGSMLPTLIGIPGFFGNGDRIIVEKISKYPNIIKHHRFETTPNRGDIIVFYPPFVKLSTNPFAIFRRLTGLFCSNKEAAFIKRVIGLPGEKIEIKQLSNGASKVYINDSPLDEDYILSEFDYTPCKSNMHCGPLIIPENQYFMMGDNRGNSYDSRYWGTVSRERLIGKAVFIFFPFNRVRVL